MISYQRILVAVDLSNEADQVIERAREFITGENTQVWLLHVVEPVISDNSYDLISSIPIDLQETLTDQANGFLHQKADKFESAKITTRVEAGSVKSEILRVAEEIQADLIIAGTHGRHGVSMLLGSTANSLLHGTPCDVLAVRIKPVES